jgi:cytochrome c-type biogenesis protein CcmF
VADIGFIALILGLVVCVYSVLASIAGQTWHDARLLASARNGVIAAFGLVTLSAAALLYALMTHDFEIEYVAAYTSRDMSDAYLFSALWAGNAGSLLLWTWLLALFAAILVRWRRPSIESLIPYASSVMLVTTGFFLVLMIFTANPFEKVAFAAPPDGTGMNPLLQNIGMVLHPPTLIAGFAGLAVPLALAVGALAVNRRDRDWLHDLRRWVLVAWVFLTIGNILGAWWAYVELGWGGYWAWDPVENSSLIPWLAATALLHSLIMQRTREKHKTWVMVLVIICFVLPILATFLTRTGYLESVHAFPDTGMGPLFSGFMIVSLVGSLALLYFKRHLLSGSQEPGSVLSKEGAFQAATILLFGAAVVTLVLTLFPKISEVFSDGRAEIGPSYFNWVVGPMFLMTILLTGICTLLGWRPLTTLNSRKFVLPLTVAVVVVVSVALATSSPAWAVASFATCAFLLTAILMELYRGVRARSRSRGENPIKAIGTSFWASRPRYGAMIVHLGIALMAIGIIGSSALEEETEVSLSRGESIAIGSYVLTYGGIEGSSTPSMDVVAATLSVQDGDSGRLIGELVPQKQFHKSYDQPVSEVAIRSTLQEDLYVALAGWDQDGSVAAFQIWVKPAVIWVWIGGGLMFFGGLIALWKRRGLLLGGPGGES